MQTVNVYIADDHEIIINGLIELLNKFNTDNHNHKYINVVGRGETAESLMGNIERDDVDVFISDLGFEGTKGKMSIVKSMLEVNALANIIVFSMRENINTIIACYQAGAKAYITKKGSMVRIFDAIFTVADGGTYYAPGVLDKIGLQTLNNPLKGLDERDQQVFIMLAERVEVEAICEELNITEKTISNIITNKIKPVLGVNKKDFRKKAIALGLVEVSL
ncbi:response regulator [Shewanella surugensis]|uniref:Response regulator transcription factor n=1 Tax=Shewanella surugensis TaxID=212020 RepID=A0ABT0LDT2_9GAMM|nr:response regulator transcription factor [Shewanella surugensis]MCL1125849.1 response regulator transcription factor [Shewanella surugensis]